MYILLLLFLFLFVGSNANKQGNFGIFSACFTKNASLRLDCYYAYCPKSPSFNCTFMANGVVLYKATDIDMCKLVLPDQYQNKSMSYDCNLVRKKRGEDKKLTINSIQSPGKRTSVNHRGKTERIKDCPGTTGLHLHQAPSLLWPVVTLSLWRVLVTDSHGT